MEYITYVKGNINTSKMLNKMVPALPGELVSVCSILRGTKIPKL